MRVIRANGTISPFPSRGVDMGIRDAVKMTSFLAACVASYSDDTLARLVQAGANPLTTDNSGKTAMHHAVINASLNHDDEFEQANFLLARAAPVEALDSIGRTPLHYAVQKGDFMSPSVIRFRLEAGADPAIPFPDASSRSMLHIMLTDLAEGGENPMTPTSMSRLLIARSLDAGLDKEARDSNGNTPVFR